jgi:hypothetical protein
MVRFRLRVRLVVRDGAQKFWSRSPTDYKRSKATRARCIVPCADHPGSIDSSSSEQAVSDFTPGSMMFIRIATSNLACRGLIESAFQQMYQLASPFMGAIVIATASHELLAQARAKNTARVVKRHLRARAGGQQQLSLGDIAGYPAYQIGCFALVGAHFAYLDIDLAQHGEKGAVALALYSDTQFWVPRVRDRIGYPRYTSVRTRSPRAPTVTVQRPALRSIHETFQKRHVGPRVRGESSDHGGGAVPHPAAAWILGRLG